jgi:hypothetical protein
MAVILSRVQRLTTPPSPICRSGPDSTICVVVGKVRGLSCPVDSRDPLKSRCPKCGAEPGQFCQSMSSICVIHAERRQGPADTKKVLIGRIKAVHPDASLRRICELLDSRIKATPVSRGALGPLESWLAKAQGSQSWVDVLDHPRTHKSVKNYLNKVHAVWLLDSAE